jgi:hypothetical protein
MNINNKYPHQEWLYILAGEYVMYEGSSNVYQSFLLMHRNSCIKQIHFTDREGIL